MRWTIYYILKHKVSLIILIINYQAFHSARQLTHDFGRPQTKAQRGWIQAADGDAQDVAALPQLRYAI